MSDFIIGRRQLYILPTRIGWYFSLILIALFGIAIKFNNQAAFMMLFILIAIGLVAMIYTHNNVIGLAISSQPSKSVFLGEPSTFPVTLSNSSAKQRSAIWLICGGFHRLSHLDAGESQSVELKLPTLQRGYLTCDPITLSSQFPIGLFFCWTKQYKSPHRCLVYPQPLNLIPLPNDGSNEGQQQQTANIRLGAEDFAGMKSYQPGDRIRDIHWPSLAKTNKLVSIQYENQSNSSVNLSWFALPTSLGQEDRLSQLCYWIIQAEQDGVRYQLEMPNHTVAFDKGLTHFHTCLRVLALWGDESE
ncbi:DUF58 domain-containing protein [Arenicella xantha]|uniref:Uncharacterized protein (DUF58 family) n=1 Tax=Arenicella xantha TaxID=644221 RepID=A0A395JIA0_9GAMM|nr:DUF58 domain-containing protein [Arenicella xantha]RBP48326.1 uncharacterized protein (DUF58 family) [Arenicella xantha]